MGQVLHGSARTTPVVRRFIHQSPESLQSLATRHGVNPPKRWPSGVSAPPRPMPRWAPNPSRRCSRPRQTPRPWSSANHTLLPLDDCPYALQETIPPLSRSALHRLFQRHGTRRLPAPAPAEKRKKFKDYPMGYLHVDFAGVHTEEGRVYPFVATDRTSQLAFAGLQPRATKILAADFLRRVLAAILHKAPKVSTDNGTQFGNMPHQVYAWRHIFDRVCDEHGTEHRFTKPAHP